MEEHDRARAEETPHASDDVAWARLERVVRAERPVRDLDAARAELARALGAWVSVREAEIARTPPEHVLERGARVAELGGEARVVARDAAGVREEVHPDLVPFARRAADDLGVEDGEPTDDEERRPRAMGGEDVEDARRPLGVGAVVERERDRASAARPLTDRAAPRELGLERADRARRRDAIDAIEPGAHEPPASHGRTPCVQRISG